MDGRGVWCEAPARGLPSGAWHDGSTAFFHSLKKPESWLHLVSAGRGGT
jgi:hypothetical protein